MVRTTLALSLLAAAVHSAAQAPTAHAPEKKVRWFVDCNGNRPTTVTVHVTEAGDYQIPAELVLKRCLDGQAT
jgi:invasion protein IalB